MSARRLVIAVGVCSLSLFACGDAADVDVGGGEMENDLIERGAVTEHDNVTAASYMIGQSEAVTLLRDDRGFELARFVWGVTGDRGELTIDGRTSRIAIKRTDSWVVDHEQVVRAYRDTAGIDERIEE